jgi:hypothetical protein
MFRSFASTLLFVSLSGTAALADDNGLPPSPPTSAAAPSSPETSSAGKSRSRAEKRRRRGRRGRSDPARRGTAAKPRTDEDSDKAHLPQIIKKPVSDDPLAGLDLGR